MKTLVNKATVILVKKRRLTTIIKTEMNFVLGKKPFTMKKWVLLFHGKFLVNNQFARAKISVE